MSTPAKVKVPETNTLRALRWVSIGALVFLVAGFLLQLPLAEVVAPWLFVIMIASYVTYAVIHTRRHRDARRATGS